MCEDDVEQLDCPAKGDALLTIASWNTNQNGDVWTHLPTLAGDGRSVDVALLQEAMPPPESARVGLCSTSPAYDDPRSWRIRGTHRRPWCSAIACYDPSIKFEPRVPVPLWLSEEGDPLVASHPGTFSVAVVTLSSGVRVVLVSLYALWDRHDTVGIFAEATLHRALSDLAPVFYGEDHVLLAGDLNIWPYDAGYGWVSKYEAVFQRLKADGMERVGPNPPAGRGALPRCPCGAEAGCTHVQTYRHQRRPDAAPYQLDYVFASKKLAPLVRSSTVRDDEAIWALSDHCPTITVLDV